MHQTGGVYWNSDETIVLNEIFIFEKFYKIERSQKPRINNFFQFLYFYFERFWIYEKVWRIIIKFLKAQ